jgi:penicillin amidase
MRRRSSSLKTLRLALGWLLGSVLALGLGLALALWATLPKPHEHLQLAGLTAPVAISLDALGMPRITAQNELDAATAMGWLHARDRMFQMDLMRRGTRKFDSL